MTYFSVLCGQTVKEYGTLTKYLSFQFLLITNHTVPQTRFGSMLFIEQLVPSDGELDAKRSAQSHSVA